MIPALTLLLACQLAGEIIAQALHLPVPGPVVGMVLLAAILIRAARLAAPLEQAADFLVRHLSLFLVPAAVGIVANGGRIAREWLPLTVSLIGSTALAMTVAALVFQAVDRRLRPREKP